MNNRSFSYFLILITSLSLIITASAYGQNASKSVVLQKHSSATQYQPLAMVNDSPITPIDLERRIKFLRIANNIPDSVQLSEKDRTKILEDLIEEIIKSQETERFKVKIDETRINDAFKIAATNFGLTEQQLSDKLLKNGLDRIYFDKVTHDKLAWEDLVQGRYARDITVSTYEVTQIIESNAVTEGISIVYNQIILPYDGSEKSKNKVQETLNTISQRLKTGEEFSIIAKDYNPNNVSKTELLTKINPELAQSLLALQPEQISQPIKVDNSVIVAQFIDKQKGNQTIINQRMLIKTGRLAYNDDVTSQEKLAEIQSLNNEPDLCKNYDDYIDDVTIFNNTTISDLPESLRAVAKATAEGETRVVREAKDSDYVLTVCKINKPDYYNDTPIEVRNKIRNQVLAHKLSLKDKEYYRNLKKYAVITLFQ